MASCSLATEPCSLEVDVARSLLEAQTRLPVYHARSPQLFARRYLVDWLAAVGGAHSLCPTARYLAVLLLDYFMDHFDIQQQQLRLVALCCLLVAAKFEERECRVPRCIQLNTYVPLPGYPSRDFLSMELNILESFNWNVALPTPAHFITHFLAVQAKDEGQRHDETQAGRVQKFTDYFLEISMQAPPVVEHVYHRYEPSCVAAACVAASRFCLRVEPLWSDCLHDHIGYSWSDLHPVVQLMLTTYNKDKATEAEKRKKEET